MDNLDKILKLVEAGYTKDEISSLLSPEISLRSKRNRKNQKSSCLIRANTLLQ